MQYLIKAVKYFFLLVAVLLLVLILLHFAPSWYMKIWTGCDYSNYDPLAENYGYMYCPDNKGIKNRTENGFDAVIDFEIVDKHMFISTAEMIFVPNEAKVCHTGNINFYSYDIKKRKTQELSKKQVVQRLASHNIYVDSGFYNLKEDYLKTYVRKERNKEVCELLKVKIYP